MKSFLGNLIDRHQSVGELLNAENKVQPRPKARFEAEPVATNAIDDYSGSNEWGEHKVQPDLENELSQNQHHPSTVVELSTENTPLPIVHSPQLRNENPGRQFDNSNNDSRFEHLDDQKNPLSINLEAQQSAEDTGRILLGNQSDQLEGPIDTSISSDKKIVNSIDHFHELNQQIEALSIRLGRQQSGINQDKAMIDMPNLEEPSVIPDLNLNPGHSSDDHLTLESELNTRIHAILQRLQNQYTLQTDSKPGIDPPQRTNAFEANHKEPSETAQVFIQPSNTSEKSDRLTQIKSRAEDSQLSARDVQHSGMLQPPNWLAALQAELSNRWEHTNTNPETEPVVNVTIGRVEVKAVQTDSATKPKTRNKPSGVMSLDDYLKQREHRGQV